MPLDPELLDILACPLSHAPLLEHEDADGRWLVSTDAATRRRYRISEDGIPILLIDESEELAEDAWKALVAAHEGRAS